MSLPSRERGLKYLGELRKLPDVCVAPFAGAWIEMPISFVCPSTLIVAPFAGAWIEIGLQISAVD